MDREDHHADQPVNSETAPSTPLQQFRSSECLLPGLWEDQPSTETSLTHVPTNGMERRPQREVVPLLRQGRRRSSSSSVEDEETSSTGPTAHDNPGQLDPELNEVLEKLLTPHNSYATALAIPRADDPDIGPDDGDRFDDSDFDEHRGLGGQTLHAHHPLVPQYLKKKLGRRKSIPPSASHPTHLQDRNFTPDFRALLDAPASFPHMLPPVSEQTEPVEGEDPQELLLQTIAPPVDEEHKVAPLRGRKAAEFYFSTESLQHESPYDSQHDIHRKSSIGSQRLQKSVSVHGEVSPERRSIEPALSRQASEANGEVRFLIGTVSDDDDIWASGGPDRRRRVRSTPHIEDPSMRRRVGSDVETILRSAPTEADEAQHLQDKDLDHMWGHRMEASRMGVRSRTVKSVLPPSAKPHLLKRADTVGAKVTPHRKKGYDHTPHEVYVEMEELIQDGEHMEWKEKARWIRYEEDVEKGGKWGKPHAASLSFHSLLELRKCLERGTVLLDLEGSDIGSITMAVVDNMVLTDQIKASEKWPVTRALLVKHRHMSENQLLSRKTGSSTSNLQHLINSFSFSRPRTASNAVTGMHMGSGDSIKDIETASHTPVDRSPSGESLKRLPHSTSFDYHQPRKMSQITRRIPLGAEGSTVLVGALDFLEEPAVAFVRLARGTFLHNVLEVDVPIRFIFVLLCPKGSLDYYEIGRSLSTLMSNKDFHDAAYRAEDRRDLLNAMNEFLADSIVLPPGHLDKPSLLPLSDIQKMNKSVQQRRRMSRKEISPMSSPARANLRRRRMSVIPDDNLHRTGRVFGGLLNDVKRRLPWYWSDIKDGLNFQCLASIFFIFFANLAPAITFGGILEDKVQQYMGVSEMLIASSICGMIFSLFSAQPLTIIGATGPLLVFEYSLYRFCKSCGIEFMPFRIWIGIWVAVLATLITAFDLGVLIRHITRFTEEVFAVLIAFIFTFESLQRIYGVFKSHPLLSVDGYCLERNKTLALRLLNGSSEQNLTRLDPCHLFGFLIPALNDSVVTSGSQSPQYAITDLAPSPAGMTNETFDRVAFFDKSAIHYANEPNTALFCVILIIGTLFIATELRQFRNSKYLGRNARRAIGDFGVPLAICAMVVFSLLVPNVHTEKLDIPKNWTTPTSPNKRTWFINPFGIKKFIAGWEIAAAVIPAILVFILMYVEVQFTCVLVNKKERKLKKGSGYHLDLLLVSFMALGCSFFGLPWMCAATVQTISHISSVSVYSRTHAPGEKPKLIQVREQRITNFFCSILIGIGIIFAGNALRLIPKAVVFGVFLYLGLSSITGVQFVDRIKLFFRPAKHHYDLNYVRKVRTWKMHAFTGIQLFCLLVLISVKSTDAALSFPFVLLLMVPLRQSLKRFYTAEELHELDKDEGDVDKSESDDEETLSKEKGSYEETVMPV